MSGARQTRRLDPPRTDLRRGHGRGLDGYFWRLSHPSSGRVLVAFCGVSQPPGRPAWGNVGLAARGLAVDTAFADLRSAAAAVDAFAVTVGEPGGPARLRADAGRLEVGFASGPALEVTLRRRRDWTTPWLGGVGAAQLIPELAHYWHPHLLGAEVDGWVRLAGARLDLSGWSAYAEHTWGTGGFPPRWWWGQAQGFADPGLCVAFAGGTVSRTVPALEATALVIDTGARRWVFGNPLRAPVRAEVGERTWRLRGVAPGTGWRVELDGEVAPGATDLRVLPVPDVRAGRSDPAAHQHLAGRLAIVLRRRGRIVLRDETSLAGLESGVSRRSG